MIWTVLDTNVLVSGLGWGGAPGAVIDAGLEGRFLMVSSGPLLEELAAVLSGRKLARLFPGDRDIVGLVATVSLVVEPVRRISAVEVDPADNRVLEAAHASGADVIVTGDHHLLALGSFEGIPIVRPRRFLGMLGP